MKDKLNYERLKKIKDVKEKMAAMSDYREHGIEWIKRNYPDQLEFVNANKDNSYEVVREKLENLFTTIFTDNKKP